MGIWLIRWTEYANTLNCSWERGDLSRPFQIDPSIMNLCFLVLVFGKNREESEIESGRVQISTTMLATLPNINSLSNFSVAIYKPKLVFYVQGQRSHGQRTSHKTTTPAAERRRRKASQLKEVSN
ncbi:hypothetical protein LINPERHAP1_LOCUS11684 [Linum perenne]